MYCFIGKQLFTLKQQLPKSTILHTDYFVVHGACKYLKNSMLSNPFAVHLCNHVIVTTIVSIVLVANYRQHLYSIKISNKALHKYFLLFSIFHVVILRLMRKAIDCDAQLKHLLKA